MKMYSPTGDPIHVATIEGGHSCVIAGDSKGTEVPEALRAAALQAGAIPVGTAPEKKPTQTPQVTKAEMIEAGVAQLMEAGVADTLANDGRPKVEPLSELVGFTVTAEERDKAFAAVKAAKQR